MAFMKSFTYFCRFRNLPVSSVSLLNKWSMCHSRCASMKVDVSSKLESRIRKKDGVDDKYTLIYRAPYETYCKVSYGVSLFSSTVIPSVFSGLLLHQGFSNFPLVIGDFPVVKEPWELYAYLGGLVFIIAQVCFVVFRYPFRIYRNIEDEDEFVMIFQHFLPWKYHKEVVRAGNVELYTKALFSFNDSVYVVNKKKAIIFEDNFRRPSDFQDLVSK